jgi:hypothetical protein
MRRFLINAFIILSATLAVLLWAAWARTWVAEDLVQREGWVEEDRRFVSYGLAWSNGRLSGFFHALQADRDAAAGARQRTPVKSRFNSIPANNNLWNWSWFTWESQSPRPVISAGGWNVPGQYSAWSGGVRIWPVAATASMLPTLWILRLRRARRVRREGLCPRCTYDLRATPARCPECGYEPQLA